MVVVKKHLGGCALAFSVGNGAGELVYVESRKLGEVLAIEVEDKAVKHGMEYYLQNGLIPLTIKKSINY